MAVDGLIVDHVGVVPLQHGAQLDRAGVRIFRDPAASDLGDALSSFQDVKMLSGSNLLYSAQWKSIWLRVNETEKKFLLSLIFFAKAAVK